MAQHYNTIMNIGQYNKQMCCPVCSRDGNMGMWEAPACDSALGLDIVWTYVDNLLSVYFKSIFFIMLLSTLTCCSFIILNH